MKRALLSVILLSVVFSFCGCTKEAKKLPVKVLIIPHFEIGEMAGDEAGEAQKFFEEYFENYDVYSVAGKNTLCYNSKNKAAMFLSGVGKVDAALSVSAVLSDKRFDFSSSHILAVGCSGGAIGYAVPGDVVLESAVCDYDLGHTADIRDLEEAESSGLWFASSDYDNSGCKKLDPDSVARAYALTKDIRLNSTDASRNMLARNFPNEAWTMRDPAVIKGTSVTSDNYWKGIYNHEKALQVTDYYKCPDPYASTEMEDVAIAYTADRFGLLDKTLILRVTVNIDTFYDGATPESLWGQRDDFIDAVSDENDETLDIFAPCMDNLFKVGKVIIDSILSGEFQSQIK